MASRIRQAHKDTDAGLERGALFADVAVPAALTDAYPVSEEKSDAAAAAPAADAGALKPTPEVAAPALDMLAPGHQPAPLIDLFQESSLPRREMRCQV